MNHIHFSVFRHDFFSTDCVIKTVLSFLDIWWKITDNAPGLLDDYLNTFFLVEVAPTNI